MYTTSPCHIQSNMALQTIHSYSAMTLQAAMQSGKYSKLRWFRFEGMSADKNDGPDGKSDSTYPLWVRHMRQAAFASACGNTYCVGTTRRSWFNASFGAAYPQMNGHPSLGPFFSFSAACMEFGRALLDELGDDAPPIGMIQSALGGSTIEAWSPNETTIACQNKTPGAPTAGKPTGHLFYGMVCPFVNMTIAGWTWYQGENNMHGDPGSSLPSGGGYVAPPPFVNSDVIVNNSLCKQRLALFYCVPSCSTLLYSLLTLRT